jgi:hypothetical protein
MRRFASPTGSGECPGPRVASRFLDGRPRRFSLLCGCGQRHDAVFCVAAIGVVTCGGLVGWHPGDFWVTVAKDVKPGAHQPVTRLVWQRAHLVSAICLVVVRPLIRSGMAILSVVDWRCGSPQSSATTRHPAWQREGCRDVAMF